ncbi:MAG: GNAT family N-acetyltransferase [Pricia sp.]
MQRRDTPWGNRFFFDLFKTGYVSPWYERPIRNRLTGDVLFDDLGGTDAYEGRKVSVNGTLEQNGLEENELSLRKKDSSAGKKDSSAGKTDASGILKGVSVIWDIPEYLEANLKDLGKRIQVTKVRQYKGFLIHLSPFKNLDGFLAEQLSSRSRKKLRSKKRKLEKEHDIRYAFYFGGIEKEEYHRLFDKFYGFLEERFEEKQAVNNNLGKWEYYRELVYPMVLEKRASLFVIYDGDKPVTIGMQFHLSRAVFSFVQSYDISYSDYNMGDISTMKRLEWCFEQGFDTFDLSMGETDYKIKWCNHRYDLYFHIFYDPKSIVSVLKARWVVSKLRFKQYLRDKDILGKLFRFDKFKYWLRNLF